MCCVVAVRLFKNGGKSRFVELTVSFLPEWHPIERHAIAFLSLTNLKNQMPPKYQPFLLDNWHYTERGAIVLDQNSELASY